MASTDVDTIKLTRRRDRNRGPRLTLEERLGPEVIKRLEAMAHEFVRFERGKFGFYMDPARYAVKQRQVGPLGKNRRRKVVAGVDKDGNVITAWVGVQGAQGRGDRGEMINIPKAYEDGAYGDDEDGEGGGGGGGGGGKGGKKKRRRKKKNGEEGSETDSDASSSSYETGSESGDGEGEGGKGKGKGGGGGGGKKDEEKKDKKEKKDPPPPSTAGAAAPATADPAKPLFTLGGGGDGKAAEGPAPDALDNDARGRKKKALHWQKVPNNLIANSFWPTLDQTTINIREQEIDDLFGMDVKEEMGGGAEEQKPEVLPHKRKHNINILLANVKMTAFEIHEVIRENRWKEMDPGVLQALLLICPTAEEETMLKTARDNNLGEQVDRTDRYMMDLGEMPAMRGKILCALSALTFNDEAVEIIRKMDLYVNMAKEVMESKKMSKWLETVLAMGNFLNSGTPKGGAHGYKLEALSMLSTVKDAKGNTLLDYIFSMIGRDNPWAYPIDDMPSLPSSAEMSLDGINEDVMGLLESVTNVTEQIKIIGDDASLAMFRTDMEAFAAEAAKTREEIVSLRGLMMSKLEDLMKFYGEKNVAARGRQEDVLRMLREFIGDTSQAAFRLQEKQEREAKKAREAAAGTKKKKAKDGKDGKEGKEGEAGGADDAKEEKKKKKKKEKAEGSGSAPPAGDAPPPPAAE